MTPQAKPADPESVFCEVCAKPVPKSQALMTEGRDFVTYFCSSACYERWRGEREEVPEPEIQEGAGRSISRDERIKRATRQHPQRDEPRADSVERDDLPPP